MSEPSTNVDFGEAHDEDNGYCAVCAELIFNDQDPFVTDCGFYHIECFICSECFSEFPDDEYIQVDNRIYCENCYNKLYSLICVSCEKPITEKIKRYKDLTWHDSCFVCNKCGKNFQSTDFCIEYEKPYCLECVGRTNKNDLICDECNEPIVEDLFKLFESYYHAWHFKCNICESDLDTNANSTGNSVFCGKCYGLFEGKVCYYCKEIISGSSCTFKGRMYHHQHVFCAKCGVSNSKAQVELDQYGYCIMDYKKLFASTCYICSAPIVHDGVDMCNKKFCSKHFRCFFCSHEFSEKTKMADIDMRPCCHACWQEFPDHAKKASK